MFSNDKNIERIADFVEEAKNWFTIRKEYTKIEIIEKVVQICTALTLTIVFAFLLVMILIFLSFAAAYAMESITGSMALAFLIISIVYTLTLIVIYFNRHTWIEKPFVRFLVNILLEDNDDESKE